MLSVTCKPVCWVSLCWVPLWWVSLFWVSLFWVLLFWVSLFWVSLCLVSLCWVSLCWVSLCWVSLCWVSSCWVPLCCVSFCWVSLCWVSLAECHYAECHYAECHSATWSVYIFVFHCWVLDSNPQLLFEDIECANGYAIAAILGQKLCCLVDDFRLSRVDLLIKVACFATKLSNIFIIRMSWSKLVTTRRWTVLSLPLH